MVDSLTPDECVGNGLRVANIDRVVTLHGGGPGLANVERDHFVPGLFEVFDQ
jgi:hypothetical protein